MPKVLVTGLEILEVTPGSQADRFGFRDHDVVLSINDAPIESMDDLNESIAHGANWSVYRDGRCIQILGLPNEIN